MIKRILAAFIATVIFAGCSIKESDDNSTDLFGEASSNTASSLDDAKLEPSSSVPEKTPVYDDTAVISAYLNGNYDGLSDKDKTILEEAKKVIPEFYRKGMSEKEIVLAAHDWIVTNLVYDRGELLAIPKKTPDTENPYGALTLRQGICMGYTTLFQLFMDMLGIDSQIITGEGKGTDVWEEHAWNLVQIDGKYYHVDTTWDDFLPDEEGRMPFHMYMLVPDTAMDVFHRWNHDNYPIADSEDLLYYESMGLLAEDEDDIKTLQRSAYELGDRYCEIMTREKTVTYEPFVTFYWTIELGDYYVTIYWLY